MINPYCYYTATCNTDRSDGDGGGIGNDSD